MSDWQKSFTKRMDGLRDQWARRFEVLAAETLDPAFEELADFLKTQGFESAAPQKQKGLRSFKFALSEDGYVLVTFRNVGLDAVEGEYEYCLPRQGMSECVRAARSNAGLNAEWVNRCFQQALDAFVERFAQCERSADTREPALA